LNNKVRVKNGDFYIDSDTKILLGHSYSNNIKSDLEKQKHIVKEVMHKLTHELREDPCDKVILDNFFMLKKYIAEYCIFLRSLDVDSLMENGTQNEISYRIETLNEFLDEIKQ